MPRKKNSKVTLKVVAHRLGLAAGTVSKVLNNAPAAQIPQRTRDRIFAAVRKLNYQPNLLARSLRTGTSATWIHSPEQRNERNALLIVGADQFERARHAMEQAGFQVHEDFSVLESGAGFPDWFTRLQRYGIARASIVRPKSPDVTEGLVGLNKGKNILKVHSEFMKGRQ